MGGVVREQAMGLLGLAHNHGDLAVKLSSLKQVKDLLVSADAAECGDLFPYFLDLQSSPETLVRKYLLEVIEEVVMNGLENSSILMPILLTLVKDYNPTVAKQAIVTGTNIFCSVLEELSLQFQQRRMVERWLDDLWTWMLKFKDAVHSLLFEDGPIGPKLLAVKYMETYVLIFTEDINDSDKRSAEDLRRHRQTFNISWLVGGHPVLDPAVLSADANRTFNLQMDLLRSANSVPALLMISIINSLATIARKRPVRYSNVLSALLEFNSNFEASKRGHAVSIQYSVRTALLGFLKCTHPMIMESRERLLKALRAMNAGEAADHVIRQVEKMMRNYERASQDAQSNKDEQVLDGHNASRNLIKKKPVPTVNEDFSTSNDISSKRTRYLSNHVATSTDDPGLNHLNGDSPKISLLDNGLTPVEQMVNMIGALIAEGERGVESLEMLISRILPDMLADIVITNLKHLPRNPPTLTKLSNTSFNKSNDSSGAAQGVGPVSSRIPMQIPITSNQMHISSSSDMSTSIDPTSDSKRDPRRDLRRLDPRRSAAPGGVNNDYLGSFESPPRSVTELNTSTVQPVQTELDCDVSPTLDKPHSVASAPSLEILLDMQVPKIEFKTKTVYSPEAPGAELSICEGEIKKEENGESMLHIEVKESLDGVMSPATQTEESRAEEMVNIIAEELYSPSLEETEQLSLDISNIEQLSEDASSDLPMLPAYVELTEEHQRNTEKNAVERIIDPDKNLRETACKNTRTALLARLAIQIVDDADLVTMIQKHIISDYKQQKGHELVVSVLYYLHTLMESDSVEIIQSPASAYDKFLIGVVQSLLDALPATDKSLSRLLGEAPLLPDPLMKLLENVCSDGCSTKDVRDGDRVTQGLGTVWSLILVRPHNRDALLDIALKCAVHPKDDIRTKAIRLVANKLYVLSYISGRIEEFARSKFLLATDQCGLDKELNQSGPIEQRTEREVGSLETSISGSQVSEPAVSEDDCVRTAQMDSQSDSLVTFGQAQSLISLYFALCAKKPSLLQLIFESYGRAPKPVKQAVLRHIPILIRALGSSYSDLLHIISDPPSGSDHLLTQVFYILSEDATLSTDLIPIVKRLYETKLKDATILIPVLSSFSKAEVLPIFPRLVDLPLDKFQKALDHILQGTAHSGPALTPAEVLVAIHGISPERDGLPLKKITDACSACFEQRTVFTQQVLEKALNQMVDQTPLPLLFMRTVIQAIDAFPNLVDFVMEILSKLINRQVWRMPKLWPGFLKCVSQTQPHSFRVLLHLPTQQLETSLNKYPNLRSSLASFANQPSVKNALARSTLEALGIAS